VHRPEFLHHNAEQFGWNRQVERGAADFAQFRLQRLERGGVVVVAIDIPQSAAQLVERRRVDAAMRLETFAGPLFQLIKIPARFRHADDRRLQMPALDHRLQGGKDLLVRQIPGRAKKHERISGNSVHRLFLFSSVRFTDSKNPDRRSDPALSVSRSFRKRVRSGSGVDSRIVNSVQSGRQPAKVK
jgi:hypothetical protein